LLYRIRQKIASLLNYFSIMKDRIFFMDKPLSLYMNKYFNTLSILLAGIYSILFFIVSVDIIDLNQKRCIIRKTNIYNTKN